ncbi:flagellar hook-basal body protein [Sporolactobacillus putidus]|uniref:Flagellar hook-basal body complex protein FlhO n=1 Tax=Sporolactobacillus putidus TaxID=492735 RepID=A0A917S1I1_9BACL|nr:flagellar hook-basal body protein [Sporolactobacillus putidus]GGL50488.1 flagellar hook-basal body complex protein FlhO [Sporolactobacillus putidus]
MIRGLYTAAAGMLAQQQREEILSNNLNNVDTPGYKSDSSTLRAFPEMLIQSLRGGVPVPQNVGVIATGVYADETVPDFSQGTVTQTGKSTDVALVTSRLPVNPRTGAQEGALLFNVRTPAGAVRYTRDGHFTINPTGQLADSAGDLVLDNAGRPIQLPSDQFQVARDGTIMVNGAAVAQIGVSYAVNTNNLVKEGGSLFRLNGGGALPPAAGNAGIDYQIKQGFLEGSNVSADGTMTNMMEAYRSFEANQKVLVILDNSLNKAVNDVGKVN